jgi:sugar transferase (PEP-CTERM system associated)
MLKLLAATSNRRSVMLIVFESALIMVAVAASAAIRLGVEQGRLLFVVGDGLLKAALIAAVCQCSLYFADLYDLRRITDRRDLFVRIIQGLGVTSFLLAAVYFWMPSLVIGRGVFVVASLVTLSLVGGWRLAFEWLAKRILPRERLLLVGTTPAVVALARELCDLGAEIGVDIVGFVDPVASRGGQALIDPGVIGTIEDIPSIVRARAVDRVVLCVAEARGQLPMDKLLDMKLEGVTFDHQASVYEEYTGKIAIENLRPSWLVFSPGFRKSRALRIAKRLADVAAALFGLVIAGPIMALVAAAVKLTSPGDIFYHQERVGQHGRIFTVHKFRSMRQDAEAATGAVWASKAGDARVTPIGRFIRKTRLDELPQLWNVLAGDMSLVGPRPERPQFVEQLTKQIPFYGQRHIVRPGLSGWAQVRYSYGASVEDAMEKLQYDLYYIKNMSLALDMFIALSTVKTVVLRRGAA